MPAVTTFRVAQLCPAILVSNGRVSKHFMSEGLILSSGETKNVWDSIPLVERVGAVQNKNVTFASVNVTLRL